MPSQRYWVQTLHAGPSVLSLHVPLLSVRVPPDVLWPPPQSQKVQFSSYRVERAELGREVPSSVSKLFPKTNNEPTFHIPPRLSGDDIRPERFTVEKLQMGLLRSARRRVI